MMNVEVMADMGERVLQFGVRLSWCVIVVCGLLLFPEAVMASEFNSKDLSKSRRSVSGERIFVEGVLPLILSEKVKLNEERQIFGVVDKFNDLIKKPYAAVKRERTDILKVQKEYPIVLLDSIVSPILSNDERMDKIFSKSDNVREGVFDYNSRRGISRGAFTESIIQIVNFSENRLKCELDLVVMAADKSSNGIIPRTMAAILSIDFNFDEHDAGACLVASLSLLLGVDLRQNEVEWSYFSPNTSVVNVTPPMTAEVLQILQKNAR